MTNKNAPRVEFTTLFNKQRKAASTEIKVAFRETVALFLETPDHPQLRNHALRKKFAGYRSLDVTGDWRAVFKEKQTEKQKIIIFHMLGTHKDLYK